MGIFKKKIKINLAGKDKSEPVAKYDEIEQGVVETPPEPVDPFAEIAAKLDKLEANQAMIVHNQQIILNTIAAGLERVFSLAGEEEEAELSEEEAAAALAEAKAKKKGAAK